MFRVWSWCPGNEQGISEFATIMKDHMFKDRTDIAWEVKPSMGQLTMLSVSDEEVAKRARAMMGLMDSMIIMLSPADEMVGLDGRTLEALKRLQSLIKGNLNCIDGLTPYDDSDWEV